ncbi:MAG: DUF4230 domain-containing protein [Planctomycetaceae bacterium]|nr:MAG: DUF4230 domain-containing protein [Planctomycetaceae bacterium]
MTQARSSIAGRLVAAIALLAAGAIIGAIWLDASRDDGGMLGKVLPKPVVSEKATLSLLRSEAMTFLVTRRSVTQIVVEHNESDWLGQWQGVLWVTVHFEWGVDMEKLSEKNIRREGDVIYCRLPEPQMLSFGIVPGSENFMSRSTAVPKMQEFFNTGGQQHRLQQAVPAMAEKFAKEQHLCPTRAEMVKQLNEASAAIKQATGADIRFE